MRADTLREHGRFPLRLAHAGALLKLKGAAALLQRLPTRPMQVTCFIYQPCNLACPYCGFWGEMGVWDRGRDRQAVSVQRWRAFVSEVAPYRPELVLTGGEPTLHPRFDRLVEAAASRRLDVTLFTNATNLGPHLQAIVTGIRWVAVSLDGASAAAHDRLRGKGTFAQVEANLRALSHAKRDRRLPFVRLHYTLHPSNVSDLPNLPDWVRALRRDGVEIAEVQVQHLWQASLAWSAVQRRLYLRHFGLDPARSTLPFYDNGAMELEGLQRSLDLFARRMRCLAPPLRWGVFPDFTRQEAAEFYAGGERIPVRFARRCLAPWTQLVFLPDGAVEVCPDLPLGRIGETALSQMLDSPTLRRLKSLAAKGAPFPFCKTCCHLYKLA